VNGDAPCHVNPLSMHIIYAEGNMGIIYETIPINISRTPNIVENIFVGVDCPLEEIQIYTELFKYFGDIFSWYYEEMLGIDPRIIEYNIKTYPNVNPVC